MFREQKYFVRVRHMGKVAGPLEAPVWEVSLPGVPLVRVRWKAGLGLEVENWPVNCNDGSRQFVGPGTTPTQQYHILWWYSDYWTCFHFNDCFLLLTVSLTVKQLHILYCQNYSLTHPNNWNQVFQSLLWPQVYKGKHLGMQTVSTNICERMGHSQELRELQHSTVTGCHLCNKSSCEIS